MIKTNPFHDNETARKQNNLTKTQIKNIRQTKGGVIVNNFINEENVNLNSIKDTFVISNDKSLPLQIYEKQSIADKKLLPLSGISLGVMGSIAMLSAFVNYSAKATKNLAKEKWLPAVTRNVNLSDESHQVIYQMVQNPNKKTVIAAVGVLAFSAMAFMGKTFFDGYKEIWVKRKEADIQKELQENLINIETQSFSGKMQIIRSMLSKYTSDFEKYINSSKEKILPDFGKKYLTNITFRGERKDKSNTFGNIILGIGTIAGIILLGLLSIKNLSKSRTHLQEYLKETREGIKTLVKSSTEKTKEIDKENLEHLFLAADASENFVKEQINQLKWGTNKEKEDLIKKILTKIRTSTTKVNPNIGGDGTPKPAFNSFVNDYKSFLYNWLLDTSNPQFALLFSGITGVTALSYGGKLAGDAIKEVEVKKINAETELNLQQRLVSTELRNFKSKKDAAIFPLVKEFYKQVDSGRSKEELKTTAENILSEIKNGPPYVFS